MWKIIILIIVVGIIDLRKISFKEKKKEIVIYFILCIITLSIGIYYNMPNHWDIL